MALSLVYGCRITIWRYLEDEERAFLERLFPGHIFQESGKKPMTVQSVANFAAARGWMPALTDLYTKVNLNKIMKAAASGGQIETLMQIKKWGGTDVNTALVAAAEHGQIQAMGLLKNWGGQGKIAAAAAARGELNAMCLALKWKSGNLSNLAGCFRAAVINGQYECAKVIKYHKYWAVDVSLENACIFQAAQNGKLEFLRKIEKWLSFHPDSILSGAVRGGHVGIMVYAKQCGAVVDYESLKLEAISSDRVEALKCLFEWEGISPKNRTEETEGLIEFAVEEGSIEIVKFFEPIIREMGIDELLFTMAYERASSSDAVIELLEKWRDEAQNSHSS